MQSIRVVSRTEEEERVKRFKDVKAERKDQRMENSIIAKRV